MQRCAASRQVSASSNPALIDQEQARTSGPLGPSCSLRSRGRRRQLPPTPCQFQNQAGGPPLSVHCVVSGSHVSVADDPDSPHRYRRLQEAPQQLQPQLQPESYNYCPQRPQVVHQNSFPEVTHSNPGHEAPPETGTFSKFRQRSHDALAQLRQRSWQQQHQEDGQERQEGNSLSSLRQKSREKLLQLRQQSLEKLSSTSQSSSSQDGSPKSQDLSFSFSKFRQQSQDKLQNLWHQDRGSLRLLPRVPSATPEQGGAGGGLKKSPLRSPLASLRAVSCSERSHSLDAETSSPSVAEVRRASVSTRSKSLSTNEGEKRPPKNPEPNARPRNHQQQQQQQQRDNPEDGGGAGGVNSSSFFRSKSSKRDEPVENHSWSFLLSLPHLIMVSNLQNLFGARGGKKPSIQPNDYMDNVIASMKTDMKERGLNELALPDQDVLVSLYNGQVTGLTNLSRRGDALLEAERDHFLLSFALQARDIRCAYWWRKQRLKGEVCAIVQRVIMNMRIRQTVSGNNPPELIDFHVEEVDGVQVNLHGLGPLNWLAKTGLRAFLRKNLKGYLEREGRDLIAQELQQSATAEESGFFW